MRIGIDAIHLSRSRKGASRFESSVIQTLAKQSLDHHFVVFLDCHFGALGLPPSDTITYVSAPAYNLLSWEQFQLPVLARRHRVRCLLTLADRLALIAPALSVMYLFEIPDYRHRMNSVVRASVYQRVADMLTRWIFPHSLARTARIAVASQATGRDLQQRYGVPPAKIEVVYAAADKVFKPTKDQARLANVRESYGAPNGYILHFCTGDPRDNTRLALAAFGGAHLPESEKLILAGGADLERTGLTSLITELGLAERVIPIGFQTGQTLIELYQAADAYIDSSLYEGFGFQVLEAMACGVPVICSDTTSLPEVVGTAALICPSGDAEAFAGGLEAVLNEPVQAAVMREAGLEQASQFSWECTARQLVRICEEAVG